MSTIQKWKVTESYLNVKCKLGEGPHYTPERNELRFMDINSSKMYFVDLGVGQSSLRCVDTGMPVGVTADIEGEEGGIILTGAKDGVTKFDTVTGKHEYVARFWEEDEEGKDKARRMRANDGAVDTAGRFWVEAFDDPEISAPIAEGVVFRLDPGGGLARMQDNLTIPNGISWNSKDDTMFLTDSPPQNVYAFDYDPVSGNISGKKIFYHHGEAGVHPDGHAMDVKGNMWHACYGGWKVIRISAQGQVTGEVKLPTRNITCPVFVGTELFITSAAEPEPEKYPDSAECAGNVFRVDVGVEGVPKRKVRLD